MHQLLDMLASLVGVPVNLLLTGVIALVLAIVLTRIGKRTGAALVFAAYPAFILYTAFPYETLIASRIAGIHTSLLAGVIVGIFYLLSYFVIVRFLSARIALSSSGSFAEALLTALCLASLFFVAWYHVLGMHGLLSFIPVIDGVLKSKEFFFFGLATPLAIFFFFIYE